MKKTVLSILLLSIGSSSQGLDLELEHPRLFMNAADVQTMVVRCHSTKQPYRNAWVDLSGKALNSVSNWLVQPYTGSGDEAAFKNFMDAGRNLLPMTFYYLVTGETNHAEKVVDSLLAYANASPKVGGLAAGLPAISAGMVTARGLIPLLYAYDLIYTYDGFDSLDKNTIEDWFCSYTNEFRQCVQDWSNNDYYDIPME